jgi:uncharacterized repeat protein (TIGR01451 family)
MKKFTTALLLTFFFTAPIVLNAQVFTAPYHDNFESGAPGWTSYADSLSRWELGSPNYGFTNSSHSGANCWDVSLNSAYTNNSDCFLNSPAFNFSNLVSVKISFWHNYNCEGYWDGTVLEYSTDTLQGWNVLGEVGSSGSTNWYSDSSLNATLLPGWTGNSNGWIQSSIIVPNFFGTSNVWFRFRFAADASVVLDGYSIDDFRIDATEANVITGTVYLDNNSNNIIDAGDSPFPNIAVQSNNGSSLEIQTTDVNGNYYFIADSTNTFAINTDNPIYSTTNPTGYNISFVGSNQISSGNDFLITYLNNIIDVGINMFQGGVRPGIQTNTYLNYYNQGTTVTSGTIILEYDNAFTLLNASQPYTITGTNTIEFTYNNLLPNQLGNIYCVFLPSSSLVLGSITHLNATINPVIGDTLIINNYDSVHPITVNSCDPNDILVEPAGDIYVQQVAAGIDLTYTIRFQNTGTAPALVVNVFNELSSNFDLSTLEIIGTSHPLTSWSLSANRLLHFEFLNINLEDSVSNEPASHGYISYRIRPLTALQIGDEIHNSAAIYFDNNAAVLTNTAITKVIDPTGIDEFNEESLVVFPNPNSGKFFVQTSKEQTSYMIVNALGQVFRSGIISNPGSLMEINLDKIATGIYMLIVDSKNVRNHTKIIVR